MKAILFTLGMLVLAVWLLSWFQQVRIWTGYVFTSIERGRMEISRTGWWYGGYSVYLGSHEGWPIQWWFAVKSRASDFRFTAPFWLWIGVAGGLLWGGRPRRQVKGSCACCGYDLASLPSAQRCPECGQAASRVRVRHVRRVAILAIGSLTGLLALSCFTCFRLIAETWYCEVQNAEITVVHQHYQQEPSGKLELEAAAHGWPGLFIKYGQNPAYWRTPIWPLPVLLGFPLLFQAAVRRKTRQKGIPSQST